MVTLRCGRLSRLATPGCPCIATGKQSTAGSRIGVPAGTMVRSGLRLLGALHARIDCVERCRAADVQSVSLLATEAQIGDRLRYVNFAQQFAAGGVAAHAVL